MRSANFVRVVLPTFSPKPRKIPRRLFSRSSSLLCTSLRAVSIARISWAVVDLQCTGRNQPSRISCAILRASLRSDFTGIAHVAGLQKLDRKASLLHGRIEPLRQRPRLKSDPGEFKPERTEPADQCLRFAHHLGLPDDLAARVDHAHARVFQ